MTFSGRVTEISHMGGLLISFEGRSPNLGDVLRINGGKILGRVDTVLGPVDSGFVHVHPVYNNIDVKRAVGSPVEIAPKKAKGPRNQKGAAKSMGEEALIMIEEAGGGQIYQGAGLEAVVIPPADIRNPERGVSIPREEGIEDDLDD